MLGGARGSPGGLQLEEGAFKYKENNLGVLYMKRKA